MSLFRFRAGFIFLLLAARASAAEPVITYEEHIKPIFREHCLKCHGEDQPKADLNLGTHGAVLKGGSGGAVVVAGRASTSLLYQAITAKDDEERMPPKKAPLPAEQVELIRVWIQSGLRESTSSKSLAAARDVSFKAVAPSAANEPLPMPEKLPAFQPVAGRRALPIIAMASSPRAPLLAVAGLEHVSLVDLRTRQPIGALPFPEGQPNVISFSSDGRILMVAGGRPVHSGRVALYDVATGRRLTGIGDENDAVLAAALSPDQQLLALGGSGKVVKLYATRDGKLRARLTKHTDWITALAFSPDGAKLASADRAGAIQLWDTAADALLLSLAEHKAAIRALAWRSDGRMLASGGEDGLLVWWDANDGWPAVTNPAAHAPPRPPGVYGRLPNGVLAAAFGPAGELLTAGRDRTARLWSAQGAAIRSFPVQSALPLQSAISADGKTLIIGDEAGHLHYQRSE